MFVNIKNNKDDILDVTTDEAIFYYKGQQIDSPYKRPILLIRLKKGQQLKCSCIASLNIGKNDGIYNGAMAYHYYDEKEPNNFELVINSSRQLDEIELIKRGCQCLIIKLDRLEKLILSNLEKEDNPEVLNKGLLKIQDENATLGNLLSYYLQEQKNIEFAGYQIPFLYINEILVRYRTDGKDIKTIITKTFNQIRDIYNHIEKEATKIKI
jgi:DNA-directed RNA polymerase subunit L